MTSAQISGTDPHPRRRVRVLDTEMSYIDVGDGDPIVFLHGNPTSSYLWRNIIPHVREYGRCLAPDLVGMGQSGPALNGAYRFVDHARYLDAWFDALDLSRRRRARPARLGISPGFLPSLPPSCPRESDRVHGGDRPAPAMGGLPERPRGDDSRPAVGRGRAARAGGELLRRDGSSPRSIIRELTDDEMAAYRAPFRDRQARRPTLVWPRELPIDGEPADVAEIVERYGTWLARSALPKLLIVAEPGALLVGRAREFCRTWPNQREVSVRGIHYLQEDSPAEIGMALREFVRGLAVAPRSAAAGAVLR